MVKPNWSNRLTKCLNRFDRNRKKHLKPNRLGKCYFEPWNSDESLIWPKFFYFFFFQLFFNKYLLGRAKNFAGIYLVFLRFLWNYYVKLKSRHLHLFSNWTKCNCKLLVFLVSTFAANCKIVGSSITFHWFQFHGIFCTTLKKTADTV